MTSGTAVADAPSPHRAITAVVLNWRTAPDAVRAGRALLADGLPPEDLVLVDNGSGDGSAAVLRNEFPSSRVVALEENLGYAGGMNAGPPCVPADAYLLVNSDAVLHRRGSLQALCRGLDDPRVGIVVPRILNPDLTLQGTVSPLRRPTTALVRASGLSRFIPNHLQPAWSIFWDHGVSRAIEYSAGPVVLVRASLWTALGGFDEGLEMYGEDLDLCWRARERGAAIWFCAGAEFVHEGAASASSRWDEPERWWRMGAAEGEVIRRHCGRIRATTTIGITCAGLAVRAVVHRLSGNRERERLARASLRGHAAAMRGSVR